MFIWKLSLIYALNGRQCDQAFEETQLGQHTRFEYHPELPSMQRVIKACIVIRRKA